MSESKSYVGRVYGYARVSSKEQNLDRQILALSEYVKPDNILTDKASGKDLDRPAYSALKGALGLRQGDTLIICSLDRLSRNKADIKKELEWFQNKGIRLKILDLPTTMVEVAKGQEWILEMITNILVEVLASIAEQERLTIRKRQREGIDAAKAKGTLFGRPQIIIPDEFPFIYKEWKSGKITAKYAMEKLNLKRSSFYKIVRDYEQQKQL